MFTKDWYKTHPHPRGMSGKKHSSNTRKRMSEIGKTRDVSYIQEYEHIVWNKGKKGLFRHSQDAKDKIGRANRGEKNGVWGGDNITYRSLHLWVSRNKGKAQKCIQCGSTSRIEWASKSHDAKRDLDDYIELCAKCHGEYDTGFKTRTKTT